MTGCVRCPAVAGLQAGSGTTMEGVVMASGWDEAYLNDQQLEARRRDWVVEHGAAIDLALDAFLTTGEWPERERFRRQLVQQGIDEDLERLLQTMPRAPWVTQPIIPERVMLPLVVLRYVPRAEPLLRVCVAIVCRAYELYRTPDIDVPVLRSDDPVLVGAAGNDGMVLRLAREVLDQSRPPGVLAGGSTGTDPTEWTNTLNDAAMPGFGGVESIDGYLSAQARMMAEARRPLRGAAAEVALPELPASPSTLEVFVLMPFREPWSDDVYAFIQRAQDRMGASIGAVHLYRADDIAAPGRITQQIEEAIMGAHAVVADITSQNGNVMWELGYAHALGKQAVILNQRPDESPFDLVDRRQYHYSLDFPDDQVLGVARHLRSALSMALGEGGPAWLSDASGEDESPT